MKYIAYCVPEFVGDGFIMSYHSIPKSESALRELSRINAVILGTEFLSERQCEMKVTQHHLANMNLQNVN